MEIRKSRLEDLNRIMEIYEHARYFMKENGNPKQWFENNWPPREVINNDIENGCSYVCRHNDKIIGTFYYNYGYDIEDTYRVIKEGNWISDNTYGVVHRLAGDGSIKGIGSFCLNWAFNRANHLRIDTHTDNLVMQGLLTKLGFIYCGIINVHEDNYPRLAYEKVLVKES